MSLIEAAILTALAGFGYLIIEFCIKPYLSYRKAVGEIEYALRYYAPVSGMTKRDIQDQAHSAHRGNASRLQTSVHQSLFLQLLCACSILPRIELIDEAYRGLIGLSNAVYLTNDHRIIDQHRQKIIKNLRLKGFQ